MKQTILVVLGGMALLTAGQASRAQEVQVLATGVTENRTWHGGQCQLELLFSGDILTNCVDILTVRLRTARDDTDRDIRLDQTDPSFRGFHSKNALTSHQRAIVRGIRLRNPERRAKVIRLVEGEADLFCPTEANGGMVIVPDFLEKPGELLATGSLQRAHLQVTYLTREMAETRRKQIEQETKKATTEPGSPSPTVIRRRLPFRRGETAEKGASLQFLIEDPEKRLKGLAFLDGAGQTVSSAEISTGANLIRTWQLDDEPVSKTQLVICVATPAALKTVPFKLENIPLP